MEGEMLIWGMMCSGHWIDVGYDCYRIFVLRENKRCYFRIQIVMPLVVFPFVVTRTDFWGQRHIPGGFWKEPGLQLGAVVPL